MIRLACSIVAVATSALAITHAQDPSPVFKAQSDLVVLHVNVFDDRSDAVPDLPQSVFRVFEDDRPKRGRKSA